MEKQTTWAKSFCAFDPETQKCLKVLKVRIAENSQVEHALHEGNEPTYYNYDVSGRNVIANSADAVALLTFCKMLGKKFELHDTAGNIYPVNSTTAGGTKYPNGINLFIPHNLSHE